MNGIIQQSFLFTLLNTSCGPSRGPLYFPFSYSENFTLRGLHQNIESDNEY